LINSFADFSVSSQVKELYQYLNHNCLGFEIVAPFVEDEFLDLLLLFVYSSKKEDKIFLVLHLFHKEKKNHFIPCHFGPFGYVLAKNVK
jgi:hypothetical protein